MKLKEIMEKCQLSEVTNLPLEAEILDGYTGDLLSDVMGNAPADSIWLTVQSHTNILAVASIVGAKAIVLCNGLHFERATVEKAKDNGIVLFETGRTSFEITGMLIKNGLKG